MAEYRVTCIPGDGIGPEIMAATKVALAATGVRIAWIDVEAGAEVMDKYGTPLPQQVIDSIRDTRVAIKGPVTTPIGSGFRSVNVALRKELDLYANLRPAVSIPGVRSRYLGVDLVLDQDQGPLLLELNARPGLAIQIANADGLMHRVKLVQEHFQELASVEARIAFARRHFAVNQPSAA